MSQIKHTLNVQDDRKSFEFLWNRTEILPTDEEPQTNKSIAAPSFSCQFTAQSDEKPERKSRLKCAVFTHT